MSEEALESLRRAVAALPDDLELRLHLAELELAAGQVAQATADVGAVLAKQPVNARAQALMMRIISPVNPVAASPVVASGNEATTTAAATTAPVPTLTATPQSPAPVTPNAPPTTASGQTAPTATAPTAAATANSANPQQTADNLTDFDWTQAEADLGSNVQPPFLDSPGDARRAAGEPTSPGLAHQTGAEGGFETAAAADDEEDWDDSDEDQDETDDFDGRVGLTGQDNGSGNRLYSAETSAITLADVGGMDDVKDRLNAAFLAPLKNPQLRALYGKSLSGGLLMYGPPGCGKTYIAKAIAGELGASFIPVGVADILEQWIGTSERNLHELFREARRSAPCVVFLDELDTLGQRRSSSNSAMAGVVNQLLTELDGIGADNEGVFVLAATNQPWQIDSALRRPGRFDRTVLVLPPDEPARAAIFQHALRDRPVEAIDLRRLAARTEGYTGADITYVCETAAERALMDSIHSGQARMIQMSDLLAALGEVRPSIGPWLETARNIVQFGEDDGTFAQLRAYLKKMKRL